MLPLLHFQRIYLKFALPLLLNYITTYLLVVFFSPCLLYPDCSFSRKYEAAVVRGGANNNVIM